MSFVICLALVVQTCSSVIQQYQVEQYISYSIHTYIHTHAATAVLQQVVRVDVSLWSVAAFFFITFYDIFLTVRVYI